MLDRVITCTGADSDMWSQGAEEGLRAAVGPGKGQGEGPLETRGFAMG